VLLNEIISILLATILTVAGWCNVAVLCQLLTALSENDADYEDDDDDYDDDAADDVSTE